MSAPEQIHCTPAVQGEAVGSITAQTIVPAIHEGALSVDHAWLRFIELAARDGWKSAACRAYVCQLAKLAAR